MTPPRILLENPACPLCGTSSRVALHGFGNFGVVRCGGCALAYLAPRPTEAYMRAKYAADAYFDSDYDGVGGYDAQAVGLRATFRHFLDGLAVRGVSGGRLLEIGCAQGYLLEAARPRFATLVGTDYSAGAVSAASRVADAVYRGGLDDVPPDAGPFDLVLATNVLEHVYAPVDFLRAATARVSPGGAVAMATPHFDNGWYRVLGRRWPSFKLPEHVTFWRAETLRRLFAGSGLVDCATTTRTPHDDN